MGLPVSMPLISPFFSSTPLQRQPEMRHRDDTARAGIGRGPIAVCPGNVRYDRGAATEVWAPRVTFSARNHCPCKTAIPNRRRRFESTRLLEPQLFASVRPFFWRRVCVPPRSMYGLRRSPEPATACVVVADRHACYLLQTRPIESAFGACRRQTLVLRAVLATGLDGRVAPSGDECVEWSGVVPRQPHRSAAKALVGRYARGLLRSLTNWVAGVWVVAARGAFRR